MGEKAHATPAEVRAEEGEVLVKGPGGISYVFTPDAAAETSDRLFDGAAQARGQELLLNRHRKRPSDPASS